MPHSQSTEVYIIGIGQVPVGELWDQSLRELAVRALRGAVADAGIEAPEALFLGNMLGALLSDQQHMGALIADWAGYRGIEAVTVEAACCSGASALRQGYLAVKSGAHRAVAVLGVEKMTDSLNGATTAGLAMAADAEAEAAVGLSFPAINALLMRRYMHEFQPRREDFAAFAMNSHANAVGNPNAMFRKAISERVYLEAPVIADPVNLMDSAPMADGAAAVVLADAETAERLGRRRVKITGSAVATDALALQDRRDMLRLDAVEASTARALAMAGRTTEDVDFFELHDAFTIMSILSLEAAGFAPKGEGYRLAAGGGISLTGRIPICTMGGLKARGHPVGATGVYQAAEAVLQLEGRAGDCQVAGARVGLIQNIGGSGATVVTHVLEAD
ncbi:MAG: thiolase domain-containing protein [Anaerolineae bacterium]|jgi:acetyl-CoA C-acetyltransferase